MEIHDTIYLQTKDDYGEDEEVVCWCQDRINDTDIEYVRKDSIKHLLEPRESVLDKLLEESEKIIEHIERPCDDGTYLEDANGEQCYMVSFDQLNEFKCAVVKAKERR